jgi:hypothetical protein
MRWRAMRTDRSLREWILPWILRRMPIAWPKFGNGLGIDRSDGRMSVDRSSAVSYRNIGRKVLDEQVDEAAQEEDCCHAT